MTVINKKKTKFRCFNTSFHAFWKSSVKTLYKEQR